MRQKAVMFARTAIRIIPPASHQILPVKPVIIAVTAVVTTQHPYRKLLVNKA